MKRESNDAGESRGGAKKKAKKEVPISTDYLKGGQQYEPRNLPKRPPGMT